MSVNEATLIRCNTNKNIESLNNIKHYEAFCIHLWDLTFFIVILKGHKTKGRKDTKGKEETKGKERKKQNKGRKKKNKRKDTKERNERRKDYIKFNHHY